MSKRLRLVIQRGLETLSPARIELERYGRFGDYRSSEEHRFPILSEGCEVGALFTSSPDPGVWPDHLSMAIENEALHDGLAAKDRESERRLLELGHFTASLQELASFSDPQSICQTLLYSVLGLVGASKGTVSFDSRFSASSPKKWDASGAALILPLEWQGVIWGQIKLGPKFNGAYTEVDQELLATVTEQATVALVNADRHRAMERVDSELKETFDSLIEVLGTSLDARHPLTRSHSKRVTGYALRLGKTIKLDDAALEHVRIASLLHDIGKMGIPDAILMKPGTYTPVEFAIMKKHASLTREILLRICFPAEQKEIPAIAGAHHEKYDGSGYPDGLSGEEIPLESRILALADVYDALTSKRDYREAMPQQQALAILEEGAGTHFDPQLAETFVAMIRQEKETR